MGLIDLEYFKKWASLGEDSTESDDLLTSMIEAASDTIEHYCRRQFAQAVVVDEVPLGDRLFVRVARPPIAATPVPIVSVGGIVLTSGYTVVSDAGLIGISGSGSGTVLVSYSGGYDPIPESVQLGCALVTGQLWFGRAMDPTVSSRSGGAFSRTRGMVDSPSGLPADAVALLRPYRLLLIAAI